MSSMETQTTPVEEKLQDMQNVQDSEREADEICLDVDLKVDAEANDTTNQSIYEQPSDVKELVDDDDDNQQCGWFGMRPRMIQFLNNPKGYLFFICMFGFGQGMTVNGLVYVVTTTLERRFNLTSARSGSISSCYDFSVMIIIVFVTYFGERSHKPKWLGTGAFIFAMGSLIFTLPHFLTEDYQPHSRTDISTCDINGTSTGACDGTGETGLSNYYWVFVTAQVLHGIGASPLYTLNVSFLDDNVKPAVLALYVGIFQATATLGPAFGFGIGGALLSLYTDVQADPVEHGLTPESPLWVGAWWIGFFITASVCLIAVLPLLGFPKELPGAKALASSRKESAHKGATYSRRSGFENEVKDFPRAIWNLFRNLPFMCMNFAAITDLLILTSIAVFGAKYLESMFNFTSGTAALIAGALTLPAALIGCLVGGKIIHHFKLDFRGQVKFCIIAMSVCFMTFFGFFIVCPNADFAGVTVQYDATHSTWEKDDANLTAQCNVNCNCTDINAYDPVCGNDDVLYYSPCHAGCLGLYEVNDNKTYYDCNCVELNNTSSAIPGKCSVSCPTMWVFIVMIFILLTCTFFPAVPQYTALVRCVAFSQRTFALGVNSLLYRALGSVPGPIVYGALIDNACLIWEKDCDGAQSCWMYDNNTLARNTMIMYMSCKIGSILFLSGALFFYKPPEDEDGGEESKEKESSVGRKVLQENIDDNKGDSNQDVTPTY